MSVSRDIIARGDEIDPIMSDWRTKYSGQPEHTNFNKIAKNIGHLKDVLKPGDSLLDVGCNQGFTYGLIGHDPYCGIDISQEYVEQARRRHPAVSFSVCDLFDLEGSWDVVFCSRVLIHVAHFELAMKKLLSVAKRAVVIVVPIGGDECIVEDYQGRQSYYRTFSRGTLERAGPHEIKPGDLYSTVIYGPARSPSS